MAKPKTIFFLIKTTTIIKRHLNQISFDFYLDSELRRKFSELHDKQTDFASRKRFSKFVEIQPRAKEKFPPMSRGGKIQYLTS